MMKKMRWMAACAAFVLAFGFSSCLDDNDDNGTSGINVAFVTIESYMGIPTLIPDCSPNLKLVPSSYDLTAYGISSSARRAFVSYTVSEGQEITEATTQVKIDLVAGSCGELSVDEISLRPDTLDGYTSAINQFERVSPYGYSYVNTYYSYPAMYAEHGYLTFAYSYRADRVGSFGLRVGGVSNDTLYLDLKAKTEGSSSIGYMIQTFDLSRCADFYMLPLVKDDSVRITVRASTDLYSMGGEETSMTVSCLKRY